LPNRKILTVRSHNWAQVNAIRLYSTGAWWSAFHLCHSSCVWLWKQHSKYVSHRWRCSTLRKFKQHLGKFH